MEIYCGRPALCDALLCVDVGEPATSQSGSRCRRCRARVRPLINWPALDRSSRRSSRSQHDQTFIHPPLPPARRRCRLRRFGPSSTTCTYRSTQLTLSSTRAFHLARTLPSSHHHSPGNSVTLQYVSLQTTVTSLNIETTYPGHILCSY